MTLYSNFKAATSSIQTKIFKIDEKLEYFKKNSH